MPSSGMSDGPDGWRLAPEGAAVHEAGRTAVIADVHLGYEWARGASGDCVPSHSLAETIARLESLLDRAPVVRLVVAGDLVETPRPCARTAADIRRLARWLAERGVELVALAGNHDPRGVKAGPETCEVGGWTIAHGHRPVAGERTVTGHLHPALRFEGLSAPCFLIGPRTIVLPAFSTNAAGWNVVAGPIPDAWRGEPLRCLASTGAELLDFGPLAALRERMKTP
jgi:uncharacterized protein